MRKITLLVILIVGGVWLWFNAGVGMVCAQGDVEQCPTTLDLTDPTAVDFGDVICIFKRASGIFLLLLPGTAAVIMLMLASFFMITAKGDATKIARGKQTATYAIIGLVIVILAAAIVNLLGVSLGIDLFKDTGGSNNTTPMTAREGVTW